MAKVNVKTDPRVLRRKLGLNQQEFWSRIYLTQSGGSRYENARGMPRTVRMLMKLVHELGIDIEKINEDNAAIIRALLAGELDQEKLKSTADQANQLMEKVMALSGSANALSAEAVALARTVSGQTAASLQ